MTSGGERGDDSTPLSADERIDAVCDDFERALAKGQNPIVKNYLSLVPEDERATLKVELEAVDLEYRFSRPEFAGGVRPTRDNDGNGDYFSLPLRRDHLIHLAEEVNDRSSTTSGTADDNRGSQEIETSDGNEAESERKTVPPTTRLFARCACIVSMAVVIFVALGWRISNNRRLAAAFVTELLNAPVDQVAPMARDASANWPAIAARLKWHLTGQPFQPSQHGHMKAVIALSQFDENYLEDVVGYLRSAHPDHLGALREALTKYGLQLSHQFWPQLESGEDLLPSHKLRIAAALAAFDPHSANWPRTAPRVTSLLLDENSVTFPVWTTMFEPIRQHLTKPLQEAIRKLQPHTAKHSRAVQLLSEFGSDQPDRGSSKTSRLFGDDADLLMEYAWYPVNRRANMPRKYAVEHSAKPALSRPIRRLQRLPRRPHGEALNKARLR